MRRKKEALLAFEWNNDHLPKIVREYREKYERISRILHENPETLDLAHRDLKKLSQGGRHGREGDFTFLDKCFKAIRPETWKRIFGKSNRHFGH